MAEPGREVRVGTGEPNAQAEDEVRREKALQGNCLRKGAFRSVGQAPRHDQENHQGVVQDRRRQDQEVLAAERVSPALTFISPLPSLPARGEGREGAAANNYAQISKEIRHGPRQTGRYRTRQAQESPQSRQGLLWPT